MLITINTAGCAQQKNELIIAPGVLADSFFGNQKQFDLFVIPIVKINYGKSYFEVRYNYDGDQTAEIYFGNRFGAEEKQSFTSQICLLIFK